MYLYIRRIHDRHSQMRCSADGWTDQKPVPPIVSRIHTKDSQNAGSRVAVILKNDRVNNTHTYMHAFLLYIISYLL